MALISAGRTEWEELKRWLSSLPTEVLASWLAEAAIRYTSLEVVLRCEAAQAAAGGLDADTMRQAIDWLTKVPPDTTWRDSHRIGAQIESVVGLLTRALERGQAAAVVELCEHALTRVEIAAMEVQDSEHWSSGVVDELSALHRRAVEIARPDPEGLATRWFHLRWKSPMGWYRNFPEQYFDVLGVTGLATLERMVTEATSNLAPMGIRKGPDCSRSELQSLRRDLLRLRGT